MWQSWHRAGTCGGIEVLVMVGGGGEDGGEGCWHQAQTRSPFLADDLGLDEFGCC